MNELIVFMCDGAPVRGEIVSIGSAWQAVLERRNDPLPYAVFWVTLWVQPPY